MRRNSPTVSLSAGRTSQQLAAAPPDSIFVWCNDSLHYPRQLARTLHRTDINIVPPSFFDTTSHSSRILTRSSVVVDHAFDYIAPERYRILRRLWEKANP